MSKNVTQEAVLAYLGKQIKDFKVNRRGSFPMFTCPFCSKVEAARFIPSTSKVNCMSCGNTGDLIEISKALGDFSIEDTHESVMDRMRNDLGLINDAKINAMFDTYEALGWDLTPLRHNSKVPFEIDWLNNPHKTKNEWLAWLDNGLNFGVKCGKRSGITIVDVDQADLPADIDLMKGNPVIAKTGRGWHLIYKYTDLPTSKIPEYSIDLLNDLKQAVIYPSKVDGIERAFTTEVVLTEMPKDLYNLLKSKVIASEPIDKLSPETIDLTNVKIDPKSFQLKNGQLDGCCNDSFLKLGGVLSKQLSAKDIEFTLKTLNTVLLEKPMDNQSVTAMCKSLERYIKKDEKEIARHIFKYLNIVEFANAREIKDALNFPKEDVDKALAYLVIEGYLIRKGRTFSIIKKANWKSELSISYNALPFDIPYFGKYATFAWGDMILLASKTKAGKTTIAMNVVKQLYDELQKHNLTNPIYYITSEAGSRFTRTAMSLGLVEGDFKWDFIADPTSIKLEDNSITVLDWLQVDDKSATDAVFKHFASELYKTQGILIVFQQLKENNEFFAPNMAKMYPSLAAKYIYTSDDGLQGQWVMEAIREPKSHCKIGVVPCAYDPGTKKLNIVNA